MLQKRTTEKSWRHSKKTHFKGPVTGVDPSSRNWKAPGKYNEVGQIINKYLWPEQQYFECVCKHGSLPMKLDLLQPTLQTQGDPPDHLRLELLPNRNAWPIWGFFQKLMNYHLNSFIPFFIISFCSFISSFILSYSFPCITLFFLSFLF